VASRRSDAEFELVDLGDYLLPHLDEPLPPSLGHHQHEHTRAWADTIASFAGFVMVTLEYNHSTQSGSVPGRVSTTVTHGHAQQLADGEQGPDPCSRPGRSPERRTWPFSRVCREAK
jgi:hypothetical protein